MRLERLGDLAALVAVGLAALYLWSPPMPWLREGAIYVAPGGSDWNDGSSPASAVATIQHAADMVAPGETVLILPGTYREEVRVRRGGEPGKPVTFKAQTPGTVTISGAAPPEVVAGLEWRDEGDGLWSAVTPWPVYHVIGDGQNLYHVRWADGTGDNVYFWVGTTGRVTILRRLAGRKGAWPAFAFEGGRLYIAFPDGQSPALHDVVIHRKIPRPYAWWTVRAADVWVEASHVEFDGLRFELGVGAGILLWNGEHVTVRDCLFSGAVTGIRASPRIRAPNDLTVEHSAYHNYPQYFWLRDWLSWKEIYSHHSYSTLVGVAADGVTVRNNLVTHAGDGLELSTPAGARRGVDIYGNLLVRGTDDAMELDGYASHVHVHRNISYDFFVSLSLSPVLGGPVLVESNLFVHPARGVNQGGIKIVNPWQGKGWGRDGFSRNIALRNNVFVGKSLSWWDAPVEDVVAEGNLFAVQTLTARTTWPPGATAQGNRVAQLGADYENPGAGCGWWRSLVPRRAVQALGQSDRGMGAEISADSGAQRPGPRWLNYSSLPATADVAASVSQELVRWQCD